ncbi:unnamed protein product [Linum trigynum]|uniref:Uncharacterized protein n=1 Tax=Linum trigynum TaxID=586398 RepID=A0AAV2EJ07_9ROSI
MDYLMEQLLPMCGRLLPIFGPLFVSDTIRHTLLVAYNLGAASFSIISVNMSSAFLNYKVGNLRAATVGNKWSVMAFFASLSISLGPMTTVHTSEALRCSDVVERAPLVWYSLAGAVSSMTFINM